MTASFWLKADYEKLTGSNPSSFRGEKLPVENISWLDAVEANFYGHYPYEIEENYFDDSDQSITREALKCLMMYLNG